MRRAGGPIVMLALALFAARCRRDRTSGYGAMGQPSHEGDARSSRHAGEATAAEGATVRDATGVLDGPHGNGTARGGAGDSANEPDGDLTDDASAALAPIAPDPIFTNLTIAGYPQAVVSVPNGATTRRPVILVLHGTGDRPDWNCDAWRHITDAHGFVLCPRGAYDPHESTAGDSRYTHRGGAYLRQHVGAAFESLAARFGPYVDTETPVAAGFSLGATQIAQLAIADPARFPRIALLEGGHAVWTDASAHDFASRGGRRVLFGCGSPWCTPLAKSAAALLERHGIEARVVYAAVGHTNDRPLQEAIMREISWFLGEDSRWEVTP